MKEEGITKGMKKQIKMIGLDCDGTLLNNNKELTEYSKEVLLKAIEQGVVVLAATGRPLSGVPKEITELPGVRYAITTNGARIVDIKEQKVIYEALLSPEKIKEILRVFEKYDAYKDIFCDGTGYASRKDWERLEEYIDTPSAVDYVRKSRMPVDSLDEILARKGQLFDKAQAVFKTIEDKEKALEEVQKIEGITATWAYDYNIEVNACGVNKGTGLLQLGEMLGIKREEIMACGDGRNDMEMLREAGFGVAVENAIEEVKKAADYITDTNENEGVAKAIAKFVLK